MILVPIPPGTVRETERAWSPFVESIARRQGEYPSVLIGQVLSGDVHIALAWDDETRKAHALIGMRILQCGDIRIGELIWLTGKRRAMWTGLLDELEIYLKQHQGCSRVRPVARLGWSRLLKAKGYRATHITFEKDI